MKAADVMVTNVAEVTPGVRAINDNLVIRPAESGY